VVNDGIASAVDVPLNLSLPDAFAGAIGPVDANNILTVFHRLSDVEDELLERGSLVAASCAGEIRAVVLIGADGSDHQEISDCKRITAEWNLRIELDKFTRLLIAPLSNAIPSSALGMSSLRHASSCQQQISMD
jgi:hypothetical protein